jgi:hypothetical protein
VAALLTDLVQFNGQLLRDLGIYLRAGEHFSAGAPVYLTTVLTEAPVDKTTYPYLYPPPSLPIAAVLAALPRVLVQVAWLTGSGAVVLAGLRLLGLSWRWALAALLWPPLFQGLYVGNVAVPAFTLFAALGVSRASEYVDNVRKVEPLIRKLFGAGLVIYGFYLVFLLIM